MLLAECDEGKACRGGLHGLLDTQVDERKIIIRAARKRTKKDTHVHLACPELTRRPIDRHAIARRV